MFKNGHPPVFFLNAHVVSLQGYVTNMLTDYCFTILGQEMNYTTYNCLHDSTIFDGVQHSLYARGDSHQPWCLARAPTEVSTHPYNYEVRLRSFNNSQGTDARVGLAFNVDSDQTFEFIYFAIELVYLYYFFTT